MFYFICSIPFLLVASKLLITNILVPQVKKKRQKIELRQKKDWPIIEKKIGILEALYKNSHAKSSSITYRLVHLMRDKEFIYGEIDFLSFYTILERASPTSQDIFYDLGSGSGKAVLSTMLFFNVHKSIGIELVPPLYEQSTLVLKKAMKRCQHHEVEKEYQPQMERVQLINDSFLQYDFSDASIIYIAATCLTDKTWNALIAKMTGLKSGSRVIVASRKIQQEQFEPIYQGIALMSWGLCPISIYKMA